MAEQKIQLRKIRDFGENINDTFLFIRQNFKPLMKSFFAISAIFMLGQAIFNGIYQSKSFGILDEIFKGGHPRAMSSPFDFIFSPEYILTIIFALLTYVSMKVCLGAYMKYYLEHDGEKPGIEDIWFIFKKYFFRVLLFNLVFWIASIIGLAFCAVPGVYIWVVFLPFGLVIMIEDASFMDCCRRCIDLIRDNFWNSFFIYAVSIMIYWVSGSIIGAVVLVVVGVATYFTTNSLGTSMGVATSFLNIFAYCFYVIYFISLTLNYFSLVEKHDGTGILRRIEAIGTNNNDLHNIEEQY
jgi:hypothetical protein